MNINIELNDAVLKSITDNYTVFGKRQIDSKMLKKIVGEYILTLKHGFEVRAMIMGFEICAKYYTENSSITAKDNREAIKVLENEIKKIVNITI